LTRNLFPSWYCCKGAHFALATFIYSTTTCHRIQPITGLPTWLVLPVQQVGLELFILSVHLYSPMCLVGLCVAHFYVVCVVFVDVVYRFVFVYAIVRSSLIYDFWFPVWYLILMKFDCYTVLVFMSLLPNSWWCM
jgi:hypothetical protein